MVTPAKESLRVRILVRRILAGVLGIKARHDTGARDFETAYVSMKISYLLLDLKNEIKSHSVKNFLNI